MTSSLFKHGLVVVGILFFVTLFLIPAAHYRAPSDPRPVWLKLWTGGGASFHSVVHSLAVLFHLLMRSPHY